MPNDCATRRRVDVMVIRSIAISVLIAALALVSTARSAAASTTAGTLHPQELYSPEGLVSSSDAHAVGPADVVDGSGGELRVRTRRGDIVSDYGAPASPSFAASATTTPAVSASGLGTGWIADSYWNDGNSASPVTSFSTTWTVPPAPASRDGQTIFLFNGQQWQVGSSVAILQPVLQWGVSSAGGGNYWSVACWYVTGSTAMYSPLVSVNTGQSLTGVMNMTGRTGNNYSYSCQFPGIANASLSVQNIPQMTQMYETLEAYSLSQCSDYPNINDTAFTGIKMVTGSSNAALSWSAQSRVTDCGQKAVVLSNSSTSGEVDLYYRSTQSNANAALAFQANTGTLWTWTGAAGTTGFGASAVDGMAAGTSPSIAALPNGNIAVAFQANTGTLWTWTGAAGTTGFGATAVDGMAAHTSPSIAVLANGNAAVAFQANTGTLWTWTGAASTTGFGATAVDGMAAGTSPSIAVLANGNAAVAFQANTGTLWTWTGAASTTGFGATAVDGMAGRSSPSITR
jgi:hypothetical protein